MALFLYKSFLGNRTWLAISIREERTAVFKQISLQKNKKQGFYSNKSSLNGLINLNDPNNNDMRDGYSVFIAFHMCA